MLEGLIVLIVFIFIVIIITKFVSTKHKRRNLKNQPLPEHLGVKNEAYLPLVQALEQSMSDSYKAAIKSRILKKHPEWVDYEYEWIFFELKRFFLINRLLKSVPLFSSLVDEIWHEMLMFTKDYEAFSKKYYHDFLHHIPNPDETIRSSDRGFFDWIYLSLFESTPNSRTIWGGFLQQPIERTVLDNFRKLSEEELIRKYFRQDRHELQVNIIEKLKNDIFHSDDVKLGIKTLKVPGTSSEQQFYNYALGAAVFYSIYEDDQYDIHMQEYHQSEFFKDQPSSVSSCTGFACSSANDFDSGGSHGDTGGSSCSAGCSS